ncbi:MAG: (Fe-S)-binding protein, partial [Deltaproteobacteria bacterium]|nr:(Fe-S)-binding protein [Deltaproteobacteria bacterium]
MAEPAKSEEKIISDVGLDVGISKLTDDQIEKVINSVIKNETGARLKTYVETCIHCGLC